VIRLARASEALRVHSVMRAAFAEYADLPNPSSALREGVADVEAVMSRGGAALDLEGDRALGSVRFVLEWDGAANDLHRAARGAVLARAPEGVLRFARLAVLPEARGEGRGVAIVRWLEALATRMRLTEVQCEARSQQPDNRPYYLALGYELVGYSGRYGIPDLRTHFRKPLVSGQPPGSAEVNRT